MLNIIDMENTKNIAINNLKIICLDMIEEAKSGHPGAAISLSPFVFILFTKIMNYNPLNLEDFNRDRFILSNGHACALLYSILFFVSNEYNLSDLRKFRKINSITHGHPEYNPSLGIEVTTGPLGQGIANGVGMALASKKLNIDNKIYVLCGDGCLMEGISYEATSLAGHLGLDNLILIYDDNKITIDGRTDICFTEDVNKRFEALNWNVLEVRDANNDYDDIENKLNLAKNNDTKKPTIIILKTNIGYGTLLQDNPKCHGSPLGKDNVKIFKKLLDFDEDKSFEIKEEVEKFFKNFKKNKSFEYITNNDLNIEPINNFKEISKLIKYFDIDKDNISTREISGLYLNRLVEIEDNLIIGSADLGSSNKTLIKNNNINKENFNNIYLNYGVREHSMAAIGNGISTFGIFPIVSTFLQFINYCLASIRLSCLSNHKILYVLTHDSIFLGEDGPTHQPIEHLDILRNMPNMYVFRPCDKNEVIGSYNYILNRDGPSSLILSRQNLPTLENSSIINTLKGGYIIYENNFFLDLIIIATGSEVHLAVNVAKSIKNINIRVVSMPCLELFENQSIDYKRNILDKKVKTISLEASKSNIWYKYVDECYDVNTFGKSGNYEDLKTYFNFNEEYLSKYIRNLF